MAKIPMSLILTFGNLNLNSDHFSLVGSMRHETEVALVSGFCSLLLLLIHWIVPKLRKMDYFNDAILNSIGGGLALGYVFLHAIPSFIHNIPFLKSQATSQFLHNEKNLLFIVFMFVLAGFCVLYALEKLAHDYTRQGKESNAVLYLSNIGVMTYLSFSITAIMPAIGHENIYSLLLFTFIMGFHFVLEDHALTHHFPTRFTHWGRYTIMLGVLGGWIYGACSQETFPTFTTVFMNAFLAGGLIISTTKTEFTLLEGKSHFPTFLASLITKTVVVFIMLLLENIG